jgi:hypothetical protein
MELTPTSNLNLMMWKLLGAPVWLLFIHGVLKFLHENRGIALPRSFDDIFKLIKGGICVGVFGYQALRWDNEKNKNSVSVYRDLLVVSPAGEKKLLPVIALVALENFLQNLTRNPGFKMDWTHCALDHNAAVCEGLSLTREVFKQMPLKEPTSYQATAIAQPCYFHVKQWLRNKKVELGRHYALIEEQFSYIRRSPSFAYRMAVDTYYCELWSGWGCSGFLARYQKLYGPESAMSAFQFSASGLPGVVPSNNLMESQNKTRGQWCSKMDRIQFINEGLQKVISSEIIVFGKGPSVTPASYVNGYWKPALVAAMVLCKEDILSTFSTEVTMKFCPQWGTVVKAWLVRNVGSTNFAWDCTKVQVEYENMLNGNVGTFHGDFTEMEKVN